MNRFEFKGSINWWSIYSNVRIHIEWLVLVYRKWKESQSNVEIAFNSADQALYIRFFSISRQHWLCDVRLNSFGTRWCAVVSRQREGGQQFHEMKNNLLFMPIELVPAESNKLPKHHSIHLSTMSMSLPMDCWMLFVPSTHSHSWWILNLCAAYIDVLYVV